MSFFKGMGRKGLTTFFRDPGTVKSMKCKVCGAECVARRNVMGPTCLAAAMGRSETLHDSFSCPNIPEDWHDKAVELYEAAEATPSESVAALIKKDLRKVLKKRK